MKKALVIGVGPLNGLGAQLCKKIANNNFEVFVAGRTKDNLDIVVNSIIQDGNKAKSLVIDTTNEEHVKNMMKFVGSGLDFAVYNVGNNRPGKIIDMDASYFKESWETGCFGGFLFAKEVIKTFLKEKTRIQLGMLDAGAEVEEKQNARTSGQRRARLEIVRVKMNGNIESLNISNSVSIVCHYITNYIKKK